MNSTTGYINVLQKRLNPNSFIVINATYTFQDFSIEFCLPLFDFHLVLNCNPFIILYPFRFRVIFPLFSVLKPVDWVNTKECIFLGRNLFCIRNRKSSREQLYLIIVHDPVIFSVPNWELQQLRFWVTVSFFLSWINESLVHLYNTWKTQLSCHQLEQPR